MGNDWYDIIHISASMYMHVRTICTCTWKLQMTLGLGTYKGSTSWLEFKHGVMRGINIPQISILELCN